MQLKQCVDSAYRLFLEKDVPSPRLNAELLMMFILGRERAYLFAHPERELTSEEQQQYDEVTTQRASGCPTQYITGHQEFWGLDLLVSPAVLIPRPETEHVVETVLELVHGYYYDHQHAPHEDPAACARLDTGRIRLVDVGTGSGCIALALASELPQAEVHGCDISDEALEMARVNAARLGLGGHVLFRRSDLLEIYLPPSSATTPATPGDAHGPASAAGASPMPEGAQFDFVVSNPPYVGLCEADKVQKQVREYEPHAAVFSGHEGMDIYRRLIPQARSALRPGGWFVTEIGFSTEDKVKQILSPESGWADVQTTTDLQGIPRVMAARKSLD